MFIIPNNLQNLDNETYKFNEYYSFAERRRSPICFFTHHPTEETYVAKLTRDYLVLLMTRHNRDFTRFYNNGRQIGFYGEISLTATKAEQTQKLVFKNFEEWGAFYQNFELFKKDQLSLQSVFDNHVQRTQELLAQESLRAYT